MIGHVVLGALLLAGRPGPTSVRLSPAERAAIDTFVGEQVAAFKSLAGENVGEFPAGRTVVAGTGETPKQELLAVRYVLERGVSWQQYLAFFDRRTLKQLAHLRIGGKEYRVVDITRFESGQLLADTLNYSDEDASCCPSVSGTTGFRFAYGQVWETGMVVRPKRH